MQSYILAKHTVVVVPGAYSKSNSRVAKLLWFSGDAYVVKDCCMGIFSKRVTDRIYSRV
ncbi:protein of unknown function [Georgfuchsia toluolica]|uniref:Uncharacterized protein n=1 Tax=Georgfuchsia toluolica TaxID=424218 RepID=A0A916NIN9_9PROT|nr:protein of unknown function [Georgfuchsia toluolica]